ncbi:unnamed protein product [Diatraea saccharalis]|uniref:Uncharacterized protein n=1 Tax=Diatraea saccharalis TaxID=40085 RepID=A0A9N9R5L1_9NEOP|nr:unnamed protein product [Diatraea saccharalis]
MKSSTRFPKMMPSYIVAFAVHETYDDIATAQQMICNKRSLQGSHSSGSPTMSTKTITLDDNSMIKLVDPNHSEKINDVKITIDDEVENQKSDSSEDLALHSGDRNEDCDTDKVFEIQNHIIDNRNKEQSNEEEIVYMEPVDPDLAISNQNGHIPRATKKKMGNRNKIKKMPFKYNKTIKNEDKRVVVKMKDTFYTNSLSHIVSRSKLLKKVITKENILDLENITSSGQANTDEDSLQSSPSTIKTSFESNFSENTLKIGSYSSLKNEISRLDISKSIENIQSKNVLPYGKDVVNVSVAVTYKPSPVNECNENIRPLADNFINTETFIFPSNMKISDSTSSQCLDKDDYLQNKQSISPSDKTLTLEPSYLNDNKIVGEESSELGNLMIDSDDTLTPNSEKFMYSENLHPKTSAFNNSDKNYGRKALLNTVMGLFPDINASTSSAINFSDNCTNVYVTGDSNNFLRITKHDTKIDDKQNNNKTALKKTFENNNEYKKLKDITLPNESAIQTMFNDTDKYCSGEVENYPKNINELWDRLVYVVDKAVKRLENSLTEKLITEMRNSFTIIESNINNFAQGNNLGSRNYNKFFSNKEVVVERENISRSQNLQCTLIGNQIIDNIMLKLSLDKQNIEFPKISRKSMQKLKEPNILEDYFEVLKPPLHEAIVIETKKDDTVTLSPGPSELEASRSFRRAKSFFVVPMKFIRENIVVIASVPAFFLGLLCLYGIIILIMKVL